MLGRLSHVAAKRVEQHEETALVCWGYRMVAGLDISNVPWSWRLRRDAEAKTPFGREHRHNILQHARVGSKSAYWKFIIEMFRSVRTLLGPMCSYWRESTSTLRSWPNPLDGSLAMCWNGLLGLAQSRFLTILIVISIYIYFTHTYVYVFLRMCWSVVYGMWARDVSFF